VIFTLLDLLLQPVNVKERREQAVNGQLTGDLFGSLGGLDAKLPLRILTRIPLRAFVAENHLSKGGRDPRMNGIHGQPELVRTEKSFTPVVVARDHFVCEPPKVS
jgi:hypothetical protein